MIRANESPNATRRRIRAIAVGLLMSSAIAGNAWADETVAISGFAFKPATVTVPVGTTVVWVNEDSAAHIVVDKQGKFRSASLGKGAKFSQTFAQAGTFDYSCAIHPSMTGKIVVGP